MDKSNQLDDILESAKFDQIKEMLFCMDGLSYSDEEMIKIIRLNGGLNACFEEVQSRYNNFLYEKRITK